MSTKVVKYRDVNTIHNGTTTISLGAANLHNAYGEQLFNLLQKAVVDTLFSGEVKVKGVAKLSPNDTYDAKTGKVIASRKAELRAHRHFLTRLQKAKKALDKYLDEGIASEQDIVKGLEDILKGI